MHVATKRKKKFVVTREREQILLLEEVVKEMQHVCTEAINFLGDQPAGVARSVVERLKGAVRLASTIQEQGPPNDRNGS